MQIPDEIIEHPQLTRLAVCFYLKLRKLAGSKNVVRSSYKSLGISAGMGGAYTQQLERNGFLQVDRDRGRGHFNTYRIIK